MKTFDFPQKENNEKNFPKNFPYFFLFIFPEADDVNFIIFILFLLLNLLERILWHFRISGNFNWLLF
jgi:hypothetical protein